MEFGKTHIMTYLIFDIEGSINSPVELAGLIVKDGICVKGWLWHILQTGDVYQNGRYSHCLSRMHIQHKLALSCKNRLPSELGGTSRFIGAAILSLRKLIKEEGVTTLVSNCSQNFSDVYNFFQMHNLMDNLIHVRHTLKPWIERVETTASKEMVQMKACEQTIGGVKCGNQLHRMTFKVGSRPSTPTACAKYRVGFHCALYDAAEVALDMGFKL